MSPRFKALHRPTPEELASKFGLYDSSLVELCKYDKDEPLPNKIVSFFLNARTPYEAKAILSLKAEVESAHNAKIVFAGYEWVTLKLPGGSYTPDWSFLLDNGQWVRVEIKASKMQPGYKDARSKLRAAASLNPWDTFYEYRNQTRAEGGGWCLELVKPDKEWLATLNLAFIDWKDQSGLG